MRRQLLASVSWEALLFSAAPIVFPACLVFSDDAVYVRRLTFLERFNNHTSGELPVHTHGVFFGETGEPLVLIGSYAAAVREARELSDVVQSVY